MYRRAILHCRGTSNADHTLSKEKLRLFGTHSEMLNDASAFFGQKNFKVFK